MKSKPVKLVALLTSHKTGKKKPFNQYKTR